MNKRIILVLFFVLLLLFTGCSPLFSYYEDRFYSEALLGTADNGKSSAESDTYTKQKAIDKALELFEKAMGKKINRNEFLESVRLYWDQAMDTFVWNITWQNNTGDDFYCKISSSDGEVLALTEYSSEMKMLSDKTAFSKIKVGYNLGETKILDALKVIFVAQGLNLDECEVWFGDKPSIGRYAQYAIYNKSDKSYYYLVWVDLQFMKAYDFQKVYVNQTN